MTSRIVHIKQPTSKSCTHTTLAMVSAGMFQPDELITMFGDQPLGYEIETMCLNMMGYLPEPLVAMGGQFRFSEYGVYLLSVTSSTPHLHHSIVMKIDGHTDKICILDPVLSKAIYINDFDDVDWKIHSCLYLKQFENKEWDAYTKFQKALKDKRSK